MGRDGTTASFLGGFSPIRPPSGRGGGGGAKPGVDGGGGGGGGGGSGGCKEPCDGCFWFRAEGKPGRGGGGGGRLTVLADNVA